MPRNGSGVYSLPAGSTFAPDTTIESAKVNAINSDLAADANTARPVTAGGTGGATVAAAKAALGFAYDSWRAFTTATGTANALTLTLSDAVPSLTTGVTISFTAASSNTTAATLNASALGAKAIRKISGGTDVALSAGDIAAAGRYTVTYDSAANAAAGAWIITTGDIAGLRKGTDVASAGTVSLGDGDLFHITGTTTITDIDFATPKDGRSATLIFDGDLTLTHNGTTLKLPGLANIPVKAGDRCTITQDSGDTIIVSNYTPAAAAPYQAGSWTPTILVNGSSTGVTYSAQVGSYIKFGALVWVLLRVTITNNGSGTGNVAIGGLPFTSKTVSGSSGILSSPFYANLSGINTTLMGSVGPASTTIDLRSSVSTTIGNMTDTNITNTADIVMVGWYEAAA